MASSSHHIDNRHDDAFARSYGFAAIDFDDVLDELICDHEGRLIDVLRAITSKDTIEEIISICSANYLHLDSDLEDMLRVPLSAKNHLTTTYFFPNTEYFKDTQILLRSSATVIINRPLKVIARAKSFGLRLDAFVIFDFNPRPSHPSGVCLILSTSIDEAVLHLVSPLPTIDEFFLPKGVSQPRTLYSNYVSSCVQSVSNGPQNVRDMRQSAIESGLAVLRLQAGINERAEESRSVALPRRLEHSFENETAAASTSHNFLCAICLDEQSMDNSVDLDCHHAICRDCTRGHVCAKIEEHSFPVLCPVCMVEQNDRPAVISGRVIQLIGINERQYAIWEEMELSQHSIPIHCRRCGRSILVDRQEHEESQILICPLPNCNYSWCKACQQPITTANDTPHSCDGTAELDDLMRQQGWKYCPNCRTPVERNGGCRHMTCIAPGCNTHFCYACGEHIISSALQGEIHAAVTTHYGDTCRMYDDDPVEGVEYAGEGVDEYVENDEDSENNEEVEDNEGTGGDQSDENDRDTRDTVTEDDEGVKDNESVEDDGCCLCC